MDALLQFYDDLDPRCAPFGRLEISQSIAERSFSVESVNSPVLDAFEQAAYEHGFVLLGFDWSNWRYGRELMRNPERIRSASLLTIRRLITAHVRADRFNGGHLASMCANGHVRALLDRLRELKGTLA